MNKKTKIVAQATIEAWTIRLYTNGDSGAYQMLDISLGSLGLSGRTFSVAPVDFAAIINGILYSEDISQFLEAVEDTWVAGRLENLISNIINDAEAL